MSKRILITISLAAFFTLSAGLVFAQRNLEVPLPAIGQDTPIVQTPLLPNYIKYIFNFSIAIAGLISFLSLVYGGFRYLTSAGNPTKMSDANDQIFSALIGLVVILGSWLLLATINPQLLILQVNRGESVPPTGINLPGVFLCKSLTGDPATDCDGPFTGDKFTLSSGFDNQTRYVKIKNSPGVNYGALLHKDTYLKGDCEIILPASGPTPDSPVIVPISRLANQISSITVFRQDASVSTGGVTLCENYDCKKKNETDTQEATKLFTFEAGQAVAGFDPSLLRGFPRLKDFYYENGDQIVGSCPVMWFCNDGVSAIKVDRGLAAVLFEDEAPSGVYSGNQCEIFFEGMDPNLHIDNNIGSDEATSMIIIKGHR